MATRKQIIDRAKQLIADNPTWGKDRVNQELRKQYGKGIRRVEVAKLKRTIVTPEARKRQTIESRHKTLTKEGFLPSEASYYAQFPISTEGMVQLRRLRASEVEKAKQYGITSRQFPKYIQDSYKAKGFLTREGQLDVQARNRAIVGELSKPRRKREALIIPPDRYTGYQFASLQKIKPKHSFQIATSIPAPMVRARLGQLSVLRKAHFTVDEAVKIITAKGPKGNLQDLDLRHPAWQINIQERINWYRDFYSRAIAKGLKPHQAAAAAINEINVYYRRDKRRTPWDWLKLYGSPTGPPRPFIDFQQSMRQRQAKIAKKRMPYKVTRAR